MSTAVIINLGVLHDEDLVCEALRDTAILTDVDKDTISRVIFGRARVDNILKGMIQSAFSKSINNASSCKYAIDAVAFLNGFDGIDVFISSGLPSRCILEKIQSYPFKDIEVFGKEDGGICEHIDCVRRRNNYNKIIFISKKESHTRKMINIAETILVNKKETRTYEADVIIDGPLTRMVIEEHIIKKA
jgi:hypothetical protein